MYYGIMKRFVLIFYTVIAFFLCANASKCSHYHLLLEVTTTTNGTVTKPISLHKRLMDYSSYDITSIDKDCVIEILNSDSCAPVSVCDDVFEETIGGSASTFTTGTPDTIRNTSSTLLTTDATTEVVMHLTSSTAIVPTKVTMETTTIDSSTEKITLSRELTTDLTTKTGISLISTTEEITSTKLTKLTAATTEPITLTDVTTEPITSTEVITEPITSTKVTTEPVISTAATTEPITSTKLTTEPITATEVTTEPITSTGVTTEPSTSIKLTTETITSTKLTTEPVISTAATTEPITSTKLTTEPITATEVTTEPITSTGVTTAPSTSTKLTTEPITAIEVTTEPIITSTGVTTEPITSTKLTIEPITTTEVTTEPITSTKVTTEPVISTAATTEPITSPAATTEPITSTKLITEPITATKVTTEPITSTGVTTEPIPSTKLTTEPITTTEVTTESITSTKVTTESVISTAATTEPITSPAVTTEPITSTKVTTEPITSTEVITEPVTSTAATTESISSTAVTTETDRSLVLTTEISKEPEPIKSKKDKICSNYYVMMEVTQTFIGGKPILDFKPVTISNILRHYSRFNLTSVYKTLADEYDCVLEITDTGSCLTNTSCLEPEITMTSKEHTFEMATKRYDLTSDTKITTNIEKTTDHKDLDIECGNYFVMLEVTRKMVRGEVQIDIKPVPMSTTLSAYSTISKDGIVKTLPDNEYCVQKYKHADVCTSDKSYIQALFEKILLKNLPTVISLDEENNKDGLILNTEIISSSPRSEVTTNDYNKYSTLLPKITTDHTSTIKETTIEFTTKTEINNSTASSEVTTNDYKYSTLIPKTTTDTSSKIKETTTNSKTNSILLTELAKEYKKKAHNTRDKDITTNSATETTTDDYSTTEFPATDTSNNEKLLATVSSEPEKDHSNVPLIVGATVLAVAGLSALAYFAYVKIKHALQYGDYHLPDDPNPI